VQSTGIFVEKYIPMFSQVQRNKMFLGAEHSHICRKMHPNIFPGAAHQNICRSSAPV
jgi:hypothetical protein